jgi:hypothetical protein
MYVFATEAELLARQHMSDGFAATSVDHPERAWQYSRSGAAWLALLPAGGTAGDTARQDVDGVPVFAPATQVSLHPTDPPGITTANWLGLGQTWNFVPASPRLYLGVTGTAACSNNSAGDGAYIELRYLGGIAPPVWNDGTFFGGISVGVPLHLHMLGTTMAFTYTAVANISITPGLSVWFDLYAGRVAGGTGTVNFYDLNLVAFDA